MSGADDSKRSDEIERIVENAESVAPSSFDPADSPPQEDSAKQGPAEILAAIEGAEILAFPAAPAGGAPPGRSPPPDDGGSGRADDGGGDDGDDGIVSQLNAEYALVLMGSRAVIMREMPDAPIEDRTRVLSIDAFKAYFSNRGSSVLRRERQADGTWIEIKRYVKWAPRWLNAKDRRTYDGIEFFPNVDGQPSTPKYFNLWRGFSVSPDPAPAAERSAKYKVFRDHLLTNVAGGDRSVFEWIFAWCAHIVQRPRERIGTAIALRGKMGTGKTKVGEIIGSLFPSHYFLVDDPRYLVGQFNAHMASCLLLQVDEGFWAGDKAAEGRLKGLVTAPKQMIEAKGVDPIRLDNYVRLLFSSNESWLVPAGMDERRFCVLDVAPHAAQNHDYFREMDAEIAAGGREALLADLLAYDLDAPGAPNLRVIPKTDALLEQKIKSLDALSNWWLERLCDGVTTRRRGEWSAYVPVDILFDDYVHAADRVGVRRKSDKVSFSRQLRKLVPGLENRKKTVAVDTEGGSETRRVPCYEIPPLQHCRDAFEEALGQKVDWEGFGGVRDEE